MEKNYCPGDFLFEKIDFGNLSKDEQLAELTK